jgi:hypothetical protein
MLARNFERMTLKNNTSTAAALFFYDEETMACARAREHSPLFIPPGKRGRVLKFISLD